MLLVFSFPVAQQMIGNRQAEKKWRVDEDNPGINHRVAAVVPDEELESVEGDDDDSQYLKIGKILKLVQ